ncbi:MAG: 50S ribosomal protein L33 [Parcubacteria group bacterium]|nr:50S ribosomal protein L33 [Parcubacteria group bacterium]
MSQDNLAKLECTECGRVNYHSTRNKKTLKQKLLLSKFCKHCDHHADHKEIK